MGGYGIESGSVIDKKMKEGFYIRFMVLALPIGLFLIGGGAILKTILSSSDVAVDPNEKVRLEAASLNRRPVDEAGLRESMTVIAERIGERNTKAKEGLDSAAFWLNSTLGGGNIGYSVERQTFEAEGVTLRNIIAELPGSERRDEIIIIGARYDSPVGSIGLIDNGSGMAGLISLARAFAGEPQARTVRFVAFSNGPGGNAPHGGDVYASRCITEGEKIVAVLTLERLATLRGEEAPVLCEPVNEAARYFADAVRTRIRSVTSLTVEGDAIDAEPSWDAESFTNLDIPTVSVSTAVNAGGPESLETIQFGPFTELVSGLKAAIDSLANP